MYVYVSIYKESKTNITVPILGTSGEERKKKDREELSHFVLHISALFFLR